MKRKTITQRDPMGPAQSSYEEEEDDGSGPFDSRTGALKDGRSFRVSMMMRDAVPRSSPGALVMYDVPPQRDELVINTSTPSMIVDAFGSVEGLNRPGARYLAAGHRTVDHAVQTTLAAMRDEAYKAYDAEAQNAWRCNAPTDTAATPDAVEAAYADYDREMSEAWRSGR